MEHKVTWNDGCVVVKTHGVGTLEGLNAMMSSILGHEQWRPGGRLLVDHSEFDAGQLTLAGIRAVADAAARARDRVGPARIAHLVSRDLEFGLVRMWENFVERQWDASMRCFRSRDEAITWLKEA